MPEEVRKLDEKLWKLYIALVNRHASLIYRKEGVDDKHAWLHEVNQLRGVLYSKPTKEQLKAVQAGYDRLAGLDL